MEARREFLLSVRDSPAALQRVVLQVHQRGVRIERLSYQAATGDTFSLHLRVTGHGSRLDSLGRQLARLVEVLRLCDGTPRTAYPVNDARSTVDLVDPVDPVDPIDPVDPLDPVRPVHTVDPVHDHPTAGPGRTARDRAVP